VKKAMPKRGKRRRGAEPTVSTTMRLRSSVREDLEAWAARARRSVSDLAQEPHVEVEVPGGTVLKKLRVPKVVLDADLFVNAPKLKTTRVGLLTLGFKNMFGVLPHEYRHPYHRLPEHYYVLVDLMKLVRGRVLTVVDGLMAMEGYGPRFGDPVQMDLVIAGRDPVATEAVPALEKALGSEDFRIRSKAAEALGNIGRKATAAVPALVKALDDQESLVRAWAAKALGQIGGKAEAAVPALIKARRDGELLVRAWALEALRKIKRRQ